MKRFLFLSAAVLLLAAPARAQDNAIKIVNPDGTVSVLEIPSDEDAMRIEPGPVTPPPAVFKSPAPAAEKPAQKPARPEIAKPIKPEPPLPAVAVAWPKDFAPYPVRKPPPPKSFVYEALAAEAAAARAEGEPIPRNEAIAIAIRNAPPARDFRVRQVMFGDRPVYAVIFRTERGESEIIVDAFTGDVVKQ